MSHHDEWIRLSGQEGPGAAAFIDRYYALETEAYRRLLSAYPDPVSGTGGDVAVRLGFDGEMAVFAGFLDGIRESVSIPVDPEAMTDETCLTIAIDPVLLFRNMLRAKARWLAELPEWDPVLPADVRDGMVREHRLAGMARSARTAGRNDPCPCGSGRKFKHCCGKTAGA